ncbi:hypothetical protein [Photobacterium sanguinicancri]|uniref:hypothetical protein n=1 Tax=Photobacterium sanguinicancri TaxID=875932 RepID=UPI000788FF17|nr:hypothetical protein [Photobacterium sanguinicancri]KXI22131.1 hypothetical protein AS132_15520 [Photobacterium sanguinicancri]
MDRAQFYQVYFDNICIFLIFGIVCVFFLYLFVNKCSVCRSSIDPAHFYITFTFGTAYSIIFGLGYLGYISVDKYFIIILFALSLFISIYISARVRTKLNVFINTVAIPTNSNGKVEFYFALVSFLFCSLITIYNAGFGLFADTNRFEQNRGIAFLSGLQIV